MLDLQINPTFALGLLTILTLEMKGRLSTTASFFYGTTVLFLMIIFVGKLKSSWWCHYQVSCMLYDLLISDNFYRHACCQNFQMCVFKNSVLSAMLAIKEYMSHNTAKASAIRLPRDTLNIIHVDSQLKTASQ